MGRVSDMAIGLEEEARDELLCEIDHWKERATRHRARADEAEALLNALVVACTTGDRTSNGAHIGVSIPSKYFVEMARAFLDGPKP